MPNENADGQSQPNAGGPTPDEASLKKMIAEAVQQHMSAVDKDDVSLDLGGRTEPKPVASNPLKEVLEPVFGPDIRQARLDAAVARDASTFYASHPEALKYMKEIEQLHQQRLAQGVPDTHETIWNWYKGQNIDKFIKEAQDADQKKIDEAKQFADGGQGVRPQGGVVKDAFSATDEELGAHLKDRPF